MPKSAPVFLVATVGSCQFSFAVVSAELFHLLDRGMRQQISFRALL
jgi:hypothetical protein